MSKVSNLAHVGCSIIMLKYRQLQGASPPDPRLRALSLDPTTGKALRPPYRLAFPRSSWAGPL